MDKKPNQELEDGKYLDPEMPRRTQSTLASAVLLTLFLVAYISWSSLNPWKSNLSASLEQWRKVQPVETSQKIPLEAHIMSKCPDARDCLHDLILPTMQRVEDKVDFTLSFIGKPAEDDGVECKHGQSECLGNMLELCAAHLYPDPKIYLGFVMCLSKDFVKIPQQDLVQDCALEHSIDFDKLNSCISSDDGFGIGLLRDSVQRSIDAGVVYSCTVRLANKIRCILDNGQWKDCEGGSSVSDLVADIDKLYNAANRPGTRE